MDDINLCIVGSLLVAVVLLVAYMFRRYNDRQLQEFCDDVYKKVYADLEKRAEIPTIVEFRYQCVEGHKHAELMAQYAEDAKRHPKPWRLWLINTSTSAKTYRECQMSDMVFRKEREYRRKSAVCRCGYCDKCYQEIMV
jgi:hypothetical protein